MTLAAVDVPVFDHDIPDFVVPRGTSVVLPGGAHTSDGSVIEYQWYSSDDGQYETMMAIPGAFKAEYKVPEDGGGIFYCIGARAVNGSSVSEWVYSRMIYVEFQQMEKPGKPIIDDVMPDCSLPLGTRLVLSGNAHASDAWSKVYYQWYRCDTNDITQIRAIDGENGATMVAPQIEGVTYYCVGTCGIWEDGTTGDWAYGRMIRVEYYREEETTEDTTDDYCSLEIMTLPGKLEYTVGETIDLTGLKVRIWLSDGFMDAYNGDKLMYSTEPFDTVGDHKFVLRYRDASEMFIVNVKAKEHVHSFSGWMVTTQPTCKEEGIQVRECECGVTERESIPKVSHTWDKGVVTVQPTADKEGVRTYTCTVCGTKTTGKIPATGKTSEKVTDKVTEKVTDKVTEKVTEKITEKVTEKITESPTEPVTEKVTDPIAKQTEEETAGIVDPETSEQNAETNKTRDKHTEKLPMDPKIEGMLVGGGVAVVGIALILLVMYLLRKKS